MDPGDRVAGRAVLALVLAGVAGWIDAVGFLTLSGLFTAHMSGNTARLGVDLGEGLLTAAVPLAAAIGLFVAANALGAGIVMLAERRGVTARTGLLLGLEAVLVVGFMVYGSTAVHDGAVADDRAAFYVLAALAIVAVGLQTSALSRVGGEFVRTTFISGILTRVGHLLVDVPAGRAGPRALALTAGIAVLYLGGAAAGTVLQTSWALWSLAIPTAVLVLAAAGAVARRA